MRTRLQFAFIGAVACAVASLVAEVAFARLNLAQTLDDRNGRALVFRSDLARRLENAGGKTGDIEIALAWNNENDLDLSVIDPNGELIYYGHKIARSGGELDVDANFVKPYTREPVENIYWPVGRAPRGHYMVRVTYWDNHGGPVDTHYRCVVLEHGRMNQISGTIGLADFKQPITIFEFDTGNGQLRTNLLMSMFHAMLITCFWSTLLSTSLAASLVGGQLWLWNKRYGRQLVSVAEVRRIVLWGVAAGCMAGAVGQMLFSLISFYYSAWPVIAGRVMGWALMGLVTGLGLGMYVPNLPRSAGAVMGAVAGSLGAWGFMTAMDTGSDVFGRLVAATVLGALIGVLICLDIEPILATASELLSSDHFSVEVMRLRANRASSAGAMRGRRAPYDRV